MTTPKKSWTDNFIDKVITIDVGNGTIYTGVADYIDKDIVHFIGTPDVPKLKCDEYSAIYIMKVKEKVEMATRYRNISLAKEPKMWERALAGDELYGVVNAGKIHWTVKKKVKKEVESEELEEI